MGWLAGASARARAAAGRLAYARGGLVHRMDLELPPAPREVVTLHDVVAWRYADESAPVAAAAEELRRAAAVICVSAFTAAEAVDLLGLRRPRRRAQRRRGPLLRRRSPSAPTRWQGSA